VTLQQLSDALDRDDTSAALDHALAVWRESRNPELAALAADLQARLPSRPIATLWKRWLAIEAEADPRDVPRQIAYLRNDGRMKNANAGIAELVKRPPNPLLATELLAMLEAVPWTAPAAIAVYEPVLVFVAGSGTSANVAALRSFEARIENIDSTKLRQQLRVLAKRSLDQINGATATFPALDEVRRAAAAFRDRATARAARTSELFAAVYANLDDDGPRLVLADHLAEVGDPRGELIALQCQSARLTAKQVARINKLVDVHGRAWLAELGEGAILKDGLVYERGFPTRARVRLWSRLASTVGNPLWSTLREAHIESGSSIVELLDPVCVSLRALHGVDGGALFQIEQTGRVLAVETIGLDYGGDDRLAGLADIANLLPKLREVDVRTPRSPALVRELLAKLPPLDRLWLFPPPSPEWRALLGPRVRELAFWMDSFRITCERDHPECLHLHVLRREYVHELRLDLGGIRVIKLRCAEAVDTAALSKQFGVPIELE
jgi:uncharacterized protein (TIGR02996 family)